MMAVHDGRFHDGRSQKNFIKQRDVVAGGPQSYVEKLFLNKLPHCS
jgi:hypothetical protein